MNVSKIAYLVLAFVGTTIVVADSYCSPVKENVSKHRFFIIKEDSPTREQLVYTLWSPPWVTYENVNLASDSGYVLGVERDIMEGDGPFLDYDFTEPVGATFYPTGPPPNMRRKTGFKIPYGLFLPAVQSHSVYTGVIRWVWNEAVYIEPTEQGGETEFGFTSPQRDEYTDNLIAPLIRGEEREIQLVVEAGRAVEVRKIFVIHGATELDKTRFALNKLNSEKQHQFDPRLIPVGEAEQSSPDLELNVSRGQVKTIDVSFEHTGSIYAGMMGCRTLHNGHPLFDVDVSFKGWEGPLVGLSMTLKTTSQAPIGTHFFRMIHRGICDAADVYKERVVKVNVK